MTGRPDIEAIKRDLAKVSASKNWRPGMPGAAQRRRELALVQWIEELEDLVEGIRENDLARLASVTGSGKNSLQAKYERKALELRLENIGRVLPLERELNDNES